LSRRLLFFRYFGRPVRWHRKMTSRNGSVMRAVAIIIVSAFTGKRYAAALVIL